MSTFFTADPHFGHANILKHCARTAFMTPADLRRFEDCGGDPARLAAFRPSAESAARMDEALIANINARVGPDDTLWCLGDWALKPRNRDDVPAYVARCRAIRDRIACRHVHLVLGNHDDRAVRPLFGFCGGDVTLVGSKEEGTPTLWLAHRPPEQVEVPEALPYPMPRAWLHGHCHARAPAPRVSAVRHLVAYDVGLDGNAYQVYAAAELAAKLAPTLAAAPRHG